MPGFKMKALSERWRADAGDYVISIAWSPDGGLLATAAVSGKITILDSGVGEVVHMLGGHEVGVTSLSWSPDGSTLASSGQDGCIRLWDTESGIERLVLQGGGSWVERVAWSPKGDMLATVAGRELRFWDKSGVLQESYKNHESTISDIAWKPGGETLAVSAYGGVTLHYPGRPELRRHLKWKGSSLKVTWSPNGKFVATGDQDATVHLWFEKNGKHLQMSGYLTKVREISWDSSSRYLATGGGNNVTIWGCSGKGPQGTKPILLGGHEDLLGALAFQNRGGVLASACRGGLLFPWRLGKYTPLAFSILDSPVSCLAWSPDDKLLAVGIESGMIKIMNPGDSKEGKTGLPGLL